jgi:hypothetical protein
MSAPVAIAEQYLAGTNSTLKLGSSPNQSSLAIMDGNWTEEAQIDDMTNSTSGGFNEDVLTIKRLTFTARCAYKTGTLPQIETGKTYAGEINTPSGPKVTGNFRITSLGGVQMNPKAGLSFSVAGTSQGPYTITGMGI